MKVLWWFSDGPSALWNCWVKSLRLMFVFYFLHGLVAWMMIFTLWYPGSSPVEEVFGWHGFFPRNNFFENIPGYYPWIAYPWILSMDCISLDIYPNIASEISLDNIQGYISLDIIRGLCFLASLFYGPATCSGTYFNCPHDIIDNTQHS